MTTALTAGGEDTVNLSKGETGDGVVLVHEDRERVDSHRNGGRLVAVATFEGSDFRSLHDSAHRAGLSNTRGECRNRGRRALAFDLNLNVGVANLESFSPEGHQIIERVRAHRVQVTGNSGSNLIVRKLSIDDDGTLSLSEHRRSGEGGDCEGLEEGIHRLGNNDIVSPYCDRLMTEGGQFGKEAPQPASQGPYRELTKKPKSNRKSR